MRDYDPTTVRYIQADPLGLVDGASVYGYALQNPGRYVDPRGEYAVGPEDMHGFKPAEESFTCETGEYDVAAEIETDGDFDFCPAGVLCPFGRGGGSKLEAGGPIIVSPSGVATSSNPATVRQGLERAGYPGRPTTATKEVGTVHGPIPTPSGPMSVRVMNGQSNGGALKGPRVRTTNSNNPNDGVRPNGQRFRNNETKAERRQGSHIHLGPF